MRILHTSDWHLGKKLDKFSRHGEQINVLNEIVESADNQDIDLVLIVGDVFDAFNPPVESIELFYKTIKRLSNFGKRPVIVIAGNHDSPDRIEAPDALALEDAIIFAGHPSVKVRKIKNQAGVELINSEEGFVELKLPQYKYPIRVLLAPYANQYRIKKFLGVENEEEELRLVLEKQWKILAENYCDDKGVNLFCGHFFFTNQGDKNTEEPEDEKPILHVGGAQAIFNTNLPEQIQYAALGHLHRRHAVNAKPCPVNYSGSPISYSFSEAGQKKYVEIIELEPGNLAKIEHKELKSGKQLARKQFDNIEEACKWLAENQDTLVELTIESEDFLSAEERKRLNECHENIISIIPIVKNEDAEKKTESSIDLNKSMQELFKDFFRFKHQQNPSEELMELFNEISASTGSVTKTGN
jgi:DNA repair protein SbcD/Mre11